MKTLDEVSIFQRAISIEDGASRKEYLATTCADDAKVLEKLTALVEAHFGEEWSLDATRASHMESGDVADEPQVGGAIGPYKLLQEIGDGGMGVVFMAEQSEPVKRKVALKVIKVGMDTRRVVARFESERQAMAMMDHVGITKILEAGATRSGRPYFVMELVNGKSITTFCDEKKLSVRLRLQLFVDVCNAIEHAHQKGVIHRDIKPSNIMVTQQDGKSIPKIIDFGIAKAINEPLTDKTMFTNYGEMVGTPLYMSPEQSEMSDQDVDTRTDIYSLGVVLYELLTGTIPFHDLRKKTFLALRDAIRSKEPQLASTRINNLGNTVEEISSNRNTDVRSLHRFVRGELDWILMKCLAIDRGNRYQSAGELASEITRHLNGELVEAAAPTLLYRTQKFVRRHRAGVGIALAFTTVLLAGTAFSTIMAVKAYDAEKLADSRLGDAIVDRDRAIVAERRLAELERKQRNRVAIQQAALTHNANAYKRLMAQGTTNENGTLELTNVPVSKLKPLKHLWQLPPGDAIATNRLNGSTSSSYTSNKESGNESAWMFADDSQNRDIQVIVCPDQHEHEETLLKTILQNQQQAFGNNDVFVARTLNQLGEFASNHGNWKQSELYFREAIGILKDSADDKGHLSDIRMKLIDSLENQGHFKKVLIELQDIKETFQDSKMRKEASGFLDRIKKRIKTTKSRTNNNDD